MKFIPLPYPTVIRNTRVRIVSYEVFWHIMVFGLPFMVYLRTMAPTVYGLDSAELTTGAYTLGIVHAPGSPLFLLLGHIFTWLPWGDIGFRVNLLSASSAALSVLLLNRLLMELTHNRIIAISTSWLLAFSYYFWITALAAELYATLACFSVLSILLAVYWFNSGQPKYLYSLTLIFGLGLGNHTSLILLGPGLAWIVLNRPGTWKNIKLILTSIGFACVGATIFLYLPIRYSSTTTLNYSRDYWGVDLTTLDGFWWMISGCVFKSLFWAKSAFEIPSEISTYVYHLWSNFLGLGFIIGIIGLIGGFIKYNVINIGLGLMWLAYLIFYIPYGAGDKEVMFTPTYIIWSLWVGLGVWSLYNYECKKFAMKLSTLTINILFILSMSGLIYNFSYVDLSQDWTARQVGEDILETIEPNALYFGSWIDVPILEYLQLVEGKRTDVIIRNLVFVSSQASYKLAKQHLTSGYPVYTSSEKWFGSSIYSYRKLTSCNCYQIELKERSY